MRVTHPMAALATGSMLGLLLVGCGGASDAPPAGPATASVTTTAAGPVTEAEFAARLRDEPALKGLPPAEVDCLARLYVKYIRPDELHGYVDGTLTLDQFNDPDNPAAKKQMLACITPPSPSR